MSEKEKELGQNEEQVYALGAIRKHGKLMAICVGGALLAFVLGDFINSGSTIFGASQNKIANINGTDIDYNEYMASVQSREDFYKTVSRRSTLSTEESEGVREEVWSKFVDDNTVGKNLEKQGLVVTDEEIATMIQVGNVPPILRNLVMGISQTGAYDPSLVKNVMSVPSLWNVIEDDMRNQRRSVKYLNYVAHGFYVTNSEVEIEFANRTRISDLKYVSLPLSSVKDEEVSVSDAAIKEYYDANKNSFFQAQESREINYLSFDVVATKEDSAEVYKSVEAIKPGLVSATDVPSYVTANSDIPYINIHYAPGDISDPIVDSLMFAEQPGFVYGPYVDGEYYKLARLIGRENVSDSIKVSHIIVPFTAINDSVAPKAKADSIMNVVKSGIDFGAMAAQFALSQREALDSGKVGWVTERSGFPKDLMDAYLATPKGGMALVNVGDAYIIVKVEDKTAPRLKASVGFASVEIRPSDDTRNRAHAAAGAFGVKNRTKEDFEKSATAEGLTIFAADNIYSTTQQLPGIPNSRSLVQWVYNDDKNKGVSEIMEFGDKYILAVLSSVNPKGIRPLESVKNDITIRVSDQLKADKLADKMKGASSVDELAAKLGVAVQEAHAINFESSQIPGIGSVPAVIAVASSLNENQVSAPVKGNTGVYVFQNTSLTPAQAIQPLNYTTDRKQMQNELRMRATYQLYSSLEQMADITDKRVKFF